MLAAPGLFAVGGCAGGQSGAEDFCGEGTQEAEPNRDATFVANGTDEDGGVEDGDANVQFSADDNGKEAANGPTSCPPPDETGEY